MNPSNLCVERGGLEAQWAFRPPHAEFDRTGRLRSSGSDRRCRTCRLRRARRATGVRAPAGRARHIARSRCRPDPHGRSCRKPIAPLFGVKVRSRSSAVSGSTNKSATSLARRLRSMRPAICILKAVVELELVEHEARKARRPVWIEQPAFDAAGGEPLIALPVRRLRLSATRSARSNGVSVHLDTAFLLTVGECLLHTVKPAFDCRVRSACSRCCRTRSGSRRCRLRAGVPRPCW